MMIGQSCPPELVFGCAAMGDPSHPQAKFNSPENTLPLFELLQTRGVTHLDTARAYPVGAPGSSEALLGSLRAGDWATIDTKVISWRPGTHTAEMIAKSIPLSLNALHMERVNIMYLHAPDRATPFGETLRAMDEAHRAGKFLELGLSNYTAEEVEEMIEICEREGYVKPTVYQGRYNALIRSGEQGLFPTLRKHGIRFYAYSPSAAGLFTGKATKNVSQDALAGSRFDGTTPLGKVYQEDYFKDELFQAADRLRAAAEKENLTAHAAALRWVMHHSALDGQYGDAIIIGASSVVQVEQNLDILAAGPLSETLLQELEGIWQMAKDSAPAYHR